MTAWVKRLVVCNVVSNVSKEYTASIFTIILNYVPAKMLVAVYQTAINHIYKRLTSPT
jgi:hypothetical protein